MQQTTEDFILDVTSFGAGIAWYTLAASVHLTAGATAAPSPFVARYVGPGHNAKTVRVFPADTTAVGGRASRCAAWSPTLPTASSRACRSGTG